jgi:hypothetical protein
MELGSIFKAIAYFLVAIFLLTFIVIITTSITNSSAWDIVPSGMTKSLAVLLPLILLFGFLIKAIVIATKRKDER